jgi:hypothetical protein
MKKTQVTAIPPGFVESMKAGFNQMAGDAATFAKNFQGVIANGTTNAFASMGAALVKGQDLFAAFGGVMLGVLGDIAIQFGTVYIAMGVGRAIASFGADAGAYALILAGGALATLGGALKAVGGGGGGTTAATPSSTVTAGSASSYTGGGGVAGGETPGENVEMFAPERENKAGVTVNIQGSVLDRRETGLAIAEVLNEYGDTNGGVVFA